MCSLFRLYIRILWQLNWTCLNSVHWFCWEITFVQKMLNLDGRKLKWDDSDAVSNMYYCWTSTKIQPSPIWIAVQIALFHRKSSLVSNKWQFFIGFGYEIQPNASCCTRWNFIRNERLRKRENTNYCAAVEMFPLPVICHRDCIKFNSFVKMILLGRCYGFVSRIRFEFRHLGQFHGRWKCDRWNSMRCHIVSHSLRFKRKKSARRTWIVFINVMHCLHKARSKFVQHSHQQHQQDPKPSTIMKENKRI